MAEEIQIKNMVCPRCIMAVKHILSGLGIEAENVSLGNALLKEPLTAEQKAGLKERLHEYGFELLDDKRSRIVDSICTAIISLARDEEADGMNINLSDYISKRCGHDYSSLSKLFTSVKGISIEKYYILQKVERVKELLVYDELSVSEIADKLGYSGVGHLSAQFKSITGLTPTAFRKLNGLGRRSLDEI